MRTPQTAPMAAPSRIDTGMLTMENAETSPPAQSPENTENITITNTSSIEAPASIICGICLSVPRFSSMSFSIFGTITAGDTAASTEPIVAASAMSSPSRSCASSVTPTISHAAGTKLSSSAGLPHFFRSDSSRLSPARVSIMISAIFRRSAEIPSSAGSSHPSIPVSFGSRRSPASSPSASPKIRISAMLSNIKASLPGRGVTKRADSPQIPKPRRNIPG